CMTSDPEDALRWDGDDDRPTLPAGWKAVGRGRERVRPDAVPPADAEARVAADSDSADAVAAVSDADDAEPQGMSTPMLLGVGVFAGIYALFTVGWLIGGQRLHTPAKFLVADAMYLPWHWLAVAAPALWFLVVWVLTR